MNTVFNLLRRVLCWPSQPHNSLGCCLTKMISAKLGNLVDFFKESTVDTIFWLFAIIVYDKFYSRNAEVVKYDVKSKVIRSWWLRTDLNIWLNVTFCAVTGTCPLVMLYKCCVDGFLKSDWSAAVHTLSRCIHQHRRMMRVSVISTCQMSVCQTAVFLNI